jgi:hypothetical protein
MGNHIPSDDLEKGDKVTVHVNSRAAGHIGQRSFDAVVVDAPPMPSVTFEAAEELENQEVPTHTWYSDIGYIHGTHTGLGRPSDIGKVRKVTPRE